MKFKGIISVRLEYDLEAESAEEAENDLSYVDLPKEYIQDSFEFVSIDKV